MPTIRFRHVLVAALLIGGMALQANFGWTGMEMDGQGAARAEASVPVRG